MGKPNKEEMNVGRGDAVKRLQTLAGQLEEGTIRLGDKSFKVPERVNLEIKADSDELEIELKWKAPAMEGRPRSEEHVRHS